MDLPPRLKDVPKSRSWQNALLFALDRSTEYLQNQEYKYGSVAIRILPFADWRFATFSHVLRSLAPWVRGMSRRGLPMFELSGTQNIESESVFLRKSQRNPYGLENRNGCSSSTSPSSPPSITRTSPIGMAFYWRRIRPILCSSRYRTSLPGAKHRTDLGCSHQKMMGGFIQ